MEKPIFIVCLHRTGSTLLNNTLDLNSDIVMIPEEMDLSSPYPWEHDFLDYCHGLDLKNKEDKERIIDISFSKKFWGSFWGKIDEFEVDEERVKRSVLDKNLSKNLEIIDSFFEYFLAENAGSRIGAKYPVFISELEKLLEWHQDSKIIHLTRDPRAIYCSKRSDEFSRRIKSKYDIGAPLVDIFTLLRVSFEYRLSSKIHKEYSTMKNYTLLRYEDLLEESIPELKNLCEFLEVDFEEDMLFPTGKPSSHTGEKETGFDSSRAHLWKSDIKEWEQKLIDLFLKNSKRTLGYSD